MDKKINLKMNGIPVTGQEGMTILEVARENGVNIPTLCYLEGASPMGACRLCVVEVEGSRTLVGSCHTPITEGMVIQTDSPKVLETRKALVELMLASHPDSCLVCDKANLCELRRIAADLNIGLPRFRARKHYYLREEENPNLIRDLSKCILCRRCVVACKNLKGERMFSIANRGFDCKVIYGLDEPVDKEACVDCDVCVSVCPTGALSKRVKVGEEKPGTALFIKG